MVNIFEGAKFGDKFLTREGKVVLYLGYHNTEFGYWFVSEDEDYVSKCDQYGRMAPVDRREDIVSRYQEPIDEDKLDIFAHCADNEYMKSIGKVPINHDYYLGFKAGYRKAMEE